MTKELVSRALFGVVVHKRPLPGLIHHGDRSSQYCAHDYQRLLRQFEMQCSMSRKGNCDERAAYPWGATRRWNASGARSRTNLCITGVTKHAHRRCARFGIFYNRQRRHSKLGYLAPAVFAQKCQQQAAA